MRGLRLVERIAFAGCELATACRNRAALATMSERDLRRPRPASVGGQVRQIDRELTCRQPGPTSDAPASFGRPTARRHSGLDPAKQEWDRCADRFMTARNGTMTMATRGFSGRRGGSDVTAERLPPGQFLENGFPVLSAGPTPRIKTEDWTFTLKDGVRPVKSWNWPEFNALPQTRMTRDIHCVTTWSKFDTAWEGVLVDDILGDAFIEPPTDFTLAHSYDGYTTNVPTADLVGGRAMVALRYEGKPIPPDHGGPARLLGAASLFLEVGQVDQRAAVHPEGRAGFLGTARLPPLRGSVAGAALHGRLSRSRALADRNSNRDRAAFADRVELLLPSAGIRSLRRGAACQRAADRARRLSGAAQLLHRLGAGDDQPHRAGDRAA